jgi:hypothetical protein
VTADEVRFLAELEVLRQGAEEASQHLYAYLTIRRRARESKRVYSHLRENSTFWLTVQRALVASCLLALGRIFDDSSVSHVATLRKFAKQRWLVLFSRDALARRKRESGIDAADAERYASEAPEATAIEFRTLTDRITALRKLYDEKYRELRDSFAHVVTTQESEIAQLFARTNVRELQRLVAALTAVHDGLWGLFWNGGPLVLRRHRYSEQPVPGLDAWAPVTTSPPYERIVVQAELVLAQASRPASKRRPRRAAKE